MDRFFYGWYISVLETIKDYLLFGGTAFLIFYILFKGFFYSRKIQKKYPKFDDYKRDIFYSFLSMIILGLSGALVFFVFSEYTLVYYNISDYGILYYIISIPLVIFLHDTYFYWTHRFMHLPSFFKIFHSIHHRAYNPSPWSAYAFNPLESIVEAAIVPIIAFIIPVHIHVFLFFFLFQIFFNVYGHLGFELYPKGFNRTLIGRWLNTSVGHNMHHKYSKNNFGLYFLFWDRWMNTLDNRYDDHFDAITNPLKEEDKVLN
ncbi:MAG: sterol desaturase family protein [Sporocytophaga sp.]|uniref:sterol desaturase family protein n=1 Tax=Sporocytophaga sp. TaxID=2231183 RepID=UPI001B008DC3|nr:sterol desaturase family protein [Sporocytophaga sp.]MBO9702738.1 sterol desaturase family protein [Sporocytophaga sp.]